MYEDKTLVCKECGQEFVFTAGEQEFYAERGFQNEPQRCKACRDAARTRPAVPGSISPLSAPPAAAKPACPSSRSLTVPCTAASASPRCGTSRDKRINPFWSLAEAAPGGRRFFFCRGSRPPRPAPGKREAFRKNVPVRTPNLHISRLFKDFLLKNIEN